MNQTLKTILLLSLSTSLFAQKPNTPAVPATPTKPAVTITTLPDSVNYMLGAFLGQYIVNNGFSISNADLFLKGMDDVLNGRTLLVNQQIIPQWINNYRLLNLNQQNRLIEKQMFDSLRKTNGIGMLPSGVCYLIVKAGTGTRPQATDSVELQLKGYLPNGQLFEDTYTKKSAYRVTAAGLMPGLSEVLQIMPKGSVWRVYIPAALAFAEKGVDGLVPPSSAVVFEVELVNK